MTLSKITGLPGFLKQKAIHPDKAFRPDNRPHKELAPLRNRGSSQSMLTEE